VVKRSGVNFGPGLSEIPFDCFLQAEFQGRLGFEAEGIAGA
jgi:hypothetical protein